MKTEEKTDARGSAMGEGNHSPTAMEEPAGSEPLIQPLPWAVRDDGELLASVIDAQGFCVTNQVTLDEAEFVCRCVNSHDALVAALKKWFGGARGCAIGKPPCEMCHDFDAALQKAEAR